MSKFLNIKIGTELYTTLTTNIVFQSNWKAISPAFYFLQRISSYNDSKNGKPVEFACTLIQQIFKPYTKGCYKPYLTALVDLGLLQIDNFYRVKSETLDGICKKYLVTPLGLDLLHTANLEYLKKLHFDKSLRRDIQKKVSNRKVMSKTYGDYVLNYIHDGLVHFEYDYNKAVAMISGSNWPTSAKESAGQSLITFSEKSFRELDYNKTDGRVYNEFVAMKSDLRKAFSYKNMALKAVLDVRACHPTFFSSYILSIFDSLPQLLHIVGYNHDISDSLTKEHNKWVELFTDPTIDPRDVIGQECGYTKEVCKSALNETLNGSKTWRVLLRWLETTFPNLYSVWMKTDVTKTGPEIGKFYESKMMLDTQLYKYTEEMNVKLAYEYDGVSIFAGERDNTFMDKLRFISRYIQSFSERTWGIRIVIKVKLTDETADDGKLDFISESRLHTFRNKLGPLVDKHEKAHAHYVRQIRKTHGFKNGTKKEIEQAAQARDRDKRTKNDVAHLIYEFKTENPDINI